MQLLRAAVHHTEVREKLRELPPQFLKDAATEHTVEGVAGIKESRPKVRKGRQRQLHRAVGDLDPPTQAYPHLAMLEEKLRNRRLLLAEHRPAHTTPQDLPRRERADAPSRLAQSPQES